MKRSISLAVLFSLATLMVRAQDPQADYDWSKYDFSVHYKFSNAGGEKILQSNKRLFIANFQVQQTIVSVGKETGKSNIAKMTVGLTPIDVKKYQAITDKLYAQVVEKFKAEGYTIVTDEEVANSDYAKKEHDGKKVFCTYADEPYYGKDANGGDNVNFWPTHKFIVVNYSPILGNWPTKFAKAFDANTVNIVLMVNNVSFDGSKGFGKKGASIEGEPNMTVQPWCMVGNERGGMAVTAGLVDGKINWVGPRAMFKADSKTDVFGSVRGNFVLDVNEEIYLSEVEAVVGGLANGFVDGLMKEIKD